MGSSNETCKKGSSYKLLVEDIFLFLNLYLMASLVLRSWLMMSGLDWMSENPVMTFPIKPESILNCLLIGRQPFIKKRLGSEIRPTNKWHCILWLEVSIYLWPKPSCWHKRMWKPILRWGLRWCDENRTITLKYLERRNERITCWIEYIIS